MSDSTKTQTIRVIHESAQALADAKQFATAQQRLDKDIADAAKKAAKERADADKVVNDLLKGYQKDTAASAKTADKERKDSAAAVNALLTGYARDEATAGRASAQAQAQAVKDATRSEIIAMKEKHQLAMLEWGQEQQAAKAAAAAQDEVTTATRGAASQILSMGASMIGLQGAGQILSQVKEAWKGIADEAVRAAEAAGLFHRESRVSGTLVGKTPEQVSPELLGLMTSSGLKREEADALYRQFYGSLPAGLQKGNITDDVAKQLLKETAVTAARQGGDTGVKGDLAGILPMFGKVESAQAGLGQLEAIRQALTEGRGDDTPLTRSLLNVAGTMVREGGPVGTLPELAALVGTTSLSAGPGMADTRALQIMRGVRGTTREQMQAIEKEFGIQAGSKMGLEERLGLMVPKLREVEKTQDVASWLTTAVGTPQEDAQALIEVMGNYDVLKKRFASARAGSTGGAAVVGQNKEFLNSALGRKMVAGSKEQAGQYLVGRQTQDAQALIESMRALQAAEPPSIGKQMEEMTYRATSLGGWGRAEAKAHEILLSQGRRQGIDQLFPSEFPGTPALTQIQHKMNVLRQHGQDPFEGSRALTGAFLDKPLERLITLQEQQLEATKQQTEAVAKGPLGAGRPLTAAPPDPNLRH